MENLEIYEKSRECPPEALREIQAGKLKGKSDINPIWRIKQLTALFGPCGVGWKLCNVRYWTEPGAGGEVSAWCSMELRIKVDGAWSDAIEGVGGSMLVATEKGKLVTNDEAFKMAYTDAVSVCCKMLGFAANVYWQNDVTKYPAKTEPDYICEECGAKIAPVKMKDGTILAPKVWAESTKKSYGSRLCVECFKKVRATEKAAAES